MIVADKRLSLKQQFGVLKYGVQLQKESDETL